MTEEERAYVSEKREDVSEEQLVDSLEASTLAALIGAVVAAHEHGLLTALAAGSDTAAGFAAALSLDARACERVLDVLASHDVAERREDRYTTGKLLSAMARVVPLGRAIALHEHTTEFLRTGKPLQLTKSSSGVYRQLTPALSRMFSSPARRLAKEVAGQPYGRIVDVGCGAGIWSLAMLQLHPKARAVGVDMPGVTQAFIDRAREMELQSRSSTLDGDYLKVALPSEPFDRVVIANVLRLEPAEQARTLVHRFADVLADDGVMVIVDALTDGGPLGERQRFGYALHLALRNAQGFPHREAEIRAWLAEAGLFYVERVLLTDSGFLAALIAKRTG